MVVAIEFATYSKRAFVPVLKSSFSKYPAGPLMKTVPDPEIVLP